ncbi:MAG: Tfp pilus assembly protein FimT/FimU [Myxococcota bacterium]
MQKFRSESGYTLIEIMTVVGITGIMATLGVVSMRNYSRHEDTRRAAVSVAGVLTQARAEAMAGGRMTFVLFAAPTDGSLAFDPGQFAAVVIDEDGDGKIGAADAVTQFFLPAGINQDVTSYGAHGDTSLKTTPLPPTDESQAVMTGDMTALVDGTTVPVDPTLGVPVIAFSPQGTPVTIDAPTNWGGGAGGVYLTDNDQMLFAVVVQPLGDVKTLAWDLRSQSWR